MLQINTGKLADDLDNNAGSESFFCLFLPCPALPCPALPCPGFPTSQILLTCQSLQTNSQVLQILGLQHAHELVLCWPMRADHVLLGSVTVYH